MYNKNGKTPGGLKEDSTQGNGASSIDKVGNGGQCPYEGSNNGGMPPKDTNPVFGADGTLPTTKTKIVGE